jgi:acetyltransferase-like isoleucine patch superfamily enzyme
MTKRIFAIIRFVYNFVYSKLNPIGYAKSIGVKMGTNVHFYGMKPNMFSTEPWLITLVNNVFITADCAFITHDGGTLILRKEVPDLELTAPIRVGNDVYMGIRAIIMPGVTIGNRVIIAAGSIVTKDIPDNSVVAGVPARVIKSVDDYLLKAQANSLHLGHLQGEDKAKELKKIFGVK